MSRGMSRSEIFDSSRLSRATPTPNFAPFRRPHIRAGCRDTPTIDPRLTPQEVGDERQPHPPRLPSDARPRRFRPVRLRAPRRAAGARHHPAATSAPRADRAAAHLAEGAGGWLRTLLGEASGCWRLAQIVEPAQFLIGFASLRHKGANTRVYWAVSVVCC